MIPSVAASTPAIARTVCHRAFRSTTTWLSNSYPAQSERQDDGNDLVRNLPPIDQDASPNFLRPRMDVMGPAATGRGSSEKSAVAAVAVADIEDIHRRAILDKQSTYIDPHTDFTVFTELAHLKRGKCCGNQCRHCPYGWSNVRGVNDASAKDNARAISGDRAGTARLVRRILDGTYYEEDERHRDEIAHQESTEESAGSNAIQGARTNVEGQGKGGSAGGTLTSKNVPYTRKGDAGTSQLFTGERRSKDDVLFEALGTVDELCSIAGVVYAALNTSETSPTAYGDLPEQLLDVMSRLFDVGSYIARSAPRDLQGAPKNDGENSGFDSRHTAVLEEWIDTMTDKLPELLSFIIPTGSPASAQLHVARTVCRRAERRMVPLVRDEGTVDPAALAYVNRLSDYFFTAARYVNYCDGRDEVQYKVEKTVQGEGGGEGATLHRERVVVKLKK
jgi:cob(I)alamin adenosyltransferase